MKNANKPKTQNVPSSGNDSIKKNMALRSLTQGASSMDEFENMLLDIDIKKPRNAFNFYIKDMREKHNISGSVTNMTGEYSEKYKKLSNSERSKYEKAAEEDKKRYEEHMALVKKYVLEKPFKEKATPYSIYVDEKLREAREKGVEELKEAKIQAKFDWENKLTADEKKEYKEKLEKHLEFYEELRKSPRPPNAFALFVQDSMAKARNNQENLNFKDVASIWAKSSSSVKERYALYASQVAEDARKHRHIYELAYGLKPKLPIGAFRFFYKEACDKELVSGKGALKKARDLFEAMKDEEKEKYLKLAKREKLAYEIKKREYKSKNKKTKTPSAYNLFVSDLKGTAPEKFSEEGFFNFAYKKWRNLDSMKKSKYEKEAKRLKEEADLEYEERKSLEKSAPKKALSAYNLFIRDRMPELKKQYPKKEQTEFFGMIAEEYANLSNNDKTKLQKRADKEKQRYEKEKTAFELEMSQMNVSQLEKQEEKKDKEREVRSKSKTTKKAGTKTDKSRSRSKSKGKDASRSHSNVESEAESEAEEEEGTKAKGNKGAKAGKGNAGTKGKKAEESEAEEKAQAKAKRGQSKKGKNTGK